MEAIVQDGLPHGAYEFQATLSNGTRPDCLILFPNGAPGLVIDAKFPLEAWNAIRAAEDAGGDAQRPRRSSAATRSKHVQDIADRYLVPGETQDTAFMFVPSESIFADIHERFEDIVQRAHRAARGDRLAVAADAVDPGGDVAPPRCRACASRRTSSSRRWSSA